MSAPDDQTRDLRSPVTDESEQGPTGGGEPQTLDAAPAVASGELAPGTMIGEYQIEDRVGHGAMGVVYGAVHPVIGKRAAVKVMRSFLSHSPEAIERFVQEARRSGASATRTSSTPSPSGSSPTGAAISSWSG